MHVTEKVSGMENYLVLPEVFPLVWLRCSYTPFLTPHLKKPCGYVVDDCSFRAVLSWKTK